MGVGLRSVFSAGGRAWVIWHRALVVAGVASVLILGAGALAALDVLRGRP